MLIDGEKKAVKNAQGRRPAGANKRCYSEFRTRQPASSQSLRNMVQRSQYTSKRGSSSRFRQRQNKDMRDAYRDKQY